MAVWSYLQSLFIFAFICFCDAHILLLPELESVSVINNELITNSVRELLIELRGQNFGSGMQIKLTTKENVCEDNINYKIKHTSIQFPNFARLVIVVPNVEENVNIFFCVHQHKPPLAVKFGEVIKWRHAGENIFIKLDPRTRSVNSSIISNNTLFSTKRLNRRETSSNLRVRGFRVEHADKEPLLSEDGNGVPVLLADTEAVLRLFGEGLTNNAWVTFTQHIGAYGSSCQLTFSKAFHVDDCITDGTTCRIRVNLPLSPGNEPFYLCIKQDDSATTEITSASNATPYVHQGNEMWLQIRTYKKLLPIYVSIIIIIVCLSFSALFSGLNLGLMSLDRTELKILCNTGNESEKKYARIIQPVRDHGNYLLCSILLGNVLVNSIFTILLDDLTSGLIAVVFSTLAIVMFGEISPQAVCSRHGLAVGARTIYITKAVMILTFPLSYPISKILDVILGEEIGNVYNRERLKELVKVTTDINDLDKDEVNIISGALELRKKTVSDVMTRIEDVFMLDYEAVLDFETVSEIMKSGFSRIPVYEGTRTNIITVLYIKDLAFVDPDDNTPLKTLCQFYQNPCNFVFEDLTLDVMFRQFKEGNKGHMAFVTRVNNEGDCDPFYETIGLVTLEDVIEELIQAEIMDETDVFTDNRSKRKRQDKMKRQDFSMFAERCENQRIHISPQLTLATYQYLSTSLDAFKPEAISETTLKRLLKQDIFRHVKKNKTQDRNDQSTYIYQQGKAVDYFVLILEGRVEVTVGRESLVFESGPFTFFGLQALAQTSGVGKSPSSRRATVSPSEGEHVRMRASVTAESPVVPSQIGSLQSLNMEALQRFSFQPDYSVRAVTNVLYMRIPRSLYMAAKRATLMERSTTDHLDDDEVKLLYSLDADEDNSVGRMSPNQPELRNSNSPEMPLTSAATSPLDPNGVITFPQTDEQHPETDAEHTALLKKQQSQNQSPRNPDNSKS